jgi:hypothetical protein
VNPEPQSSWRHVTRPQGLREPVNRHTLAIALVCVPVIFGAFAISALGPDTATVGSAFGAAAVFGAIAGWVHPPRRSLRPGGAVAWVVIATGALAATYGYVRWRGGDRKVRVGYELVLPSVIGGLPGVVLYYAFVRRHGKR